MSCETKDCGWCDKLGPEEAREQLCADCDAADTNEKLNQMIESLQAQLNQWKELAQARYSKMVDAKLALKKANETCEFLREEVMRKSAQVEFLR